MKYKMLQFKDDMLTDFWFIPLAMTIVSFELSLSMSMIDLFIDTKEIELHLSKIVSKESISIVFPVLATSTITMTSIVFSITVLILSIAENQLGPRLLPNFMRQNTTQFVFGFIIGTFIYTIVILQVHSANIDNNIHLYMSELLGPIFGILSLLILIYFIHYICYVLQIDNMLDFLANDLKDCLRRISSQSDQHRINSHTQATVDDTLNVEDQKLGKASILLVADE